MNKEQIEAILDYIDKKIEYELASIERDEEGYGGACVEERKSMERAKGQLYAVQDTS